MPSRPDFGLCDACAWQRLVPTTRGSEFTMCLRHSHDPRFPRYPRIPVRECSGFERREGPSPDRG